MANYSRRQLLRGKHIAIRPPWAQEEEVFINTCSRCNACITHCPEKIIIKGQGGFPEVNFTLGECTFCESCLENCPTTALIKQQEDSQPWSLTLEVTAECLPKHGVVCITCREFCEQQVFTFPPQQGGVTTPQITAENCTGCGACISVCPTQAIKLT